ncbi:cytochrome c4 [Pseudoprimorskyibacter insulae]|uniref:Cytochrome c domain-containing protein n=1 Tax=Pseudoprimorskyibacter insulae TaxID=1695997 RepID=A0A2R8B0W4_9RHOB|nr:cytochrome c [Pseudoprimorskyibacter insulae]SPF81903.1 hypothetical protein PRI8871_03729 [Pseudoprimorskyibacter insulae]
MGMKFAAFAALGLGLGLVACTEAEMPGPSDGQALFMNYCAACHGPTGNGKGPMAEGLNQAPKDLTLIAARHGGTFPRAKIMSIIDGYARSDQSLPGMPEFGALLESDLVPFDSGDGKLTPTPRNLVAILEYLETIQVSR